MVSSCSLNILPNFPSFRTIAFLITNYQRRTSRGCPWPRGHILKSLTLKVKSSASSLQKLPCLQLEDSTLGLEPYVLDSTSANYFSNSYFFNFVLLHLSVLLN